MYRSFYLFHVPRQHVEAFVRINQEAGEIYRRYGALGGALMRATGVDAKYGCTGLADVLSPSEGEVIFAGFDDFHDADHHRAVMARVDADPRINELFDEIQTLIALPKVVRGEFESVG